MQLIKTPIEFNRSKETDQILLLGSWCLRDAKHCLDNVRRHNLVPYHWEDRDKFKADYIYLTSLYEKTLSAFTPILNDLHKLNKDREYWRVVIGPWLRFFIDAVFDRYEIIRTAKQIAGLTSCLIQPYNLEDWHTKNFEDFYADLISDEWNEIVFSECIKFQGLPFQKCAGLEIKPQRGHFTPLGVGLNLKKFIKKTMSGYSKFVTNSKRKVVFVGSYMPKVNLIKLHLKLRQLPYSPLGIIRLPSCKKNNSLRNNLISSSKDTNFEEFLSYLLPKMMPIIYLETYDTVRKDILRFLPHNPAIIFTSISYQADDIIKIWMAEKKEIGARLIINQHGGHFGIGKYNQTVEHQIMIASDFVSWGWGKKSHHKVTNLPSLKLANASKISPKRNGKILHIFSSLPRYFYCNYSMPLAGQYLLYINQQIAFIKRLNQLSLNNLMIRLDPSFENKSWDLYKLFESEGCLKFVENSKNDLWASVIKSRLCVCTSNTTTFLETLSRNFPTIIFWDKSLNEIKPDAKPMLDLLVNAEILFYSPEAAASNVNCLDNNVDDWWYSKKVQSARKEFCLKYALKTTDWLHEWSNFFTAR